MSDLPPGRPKAKRITSEAIPIPKPPFAPDYPTVHLRMRFVVGGPSVLQQEWRLADGTHEWRDVPTVMTEESGVSFG
jgi:hypothetical protein